MRSRKGEELRKAQRFPSSFSVVPFSRHDYEVAFGLVVKYRLQTGLGLGDFLITAQAMSRQAPLLSFNLKHIGAVDGPDVRSPYLR